MTQPPPRFRSVTRRHLHDAILAATETLGGQAGWDAFRMADVAAAVGISRQTLYAEFGSKPALVRAVVLDRVDRLTASLTGVLTAADGGVHGAVRAAARFLLDVARADPLVKCLVSGHDGDLLALVTTDSAPIIDGAVGALTAYATEVRPAVDARRVAVAANAFARLVISHVVLPDHEIGDAAADVADVIGPYLTDVLSAV
jgi:AcrR family transcriptional regulator